MATRNMGTAASNTNDVATKGDVTSALNAADGSGLTDNGSGVLAVGAGTGITVNADDVAVSANYRSNAMPFHISGAVTTGVKTPKFIAPVAMTVVDMYAILASGSGTTTIRPSKNAGSSDGSTLNVTTSSGHTTQSLALAAGDTLTVNVTAIGTTPTDLSVTFWAKVD